MNIFIALQPVVSLERLTLSVSASLFITTSSCVAAGKLEYQMKALGNTALGE